MGKQNKSKKGRKVGRKLNQSAQRRYVSEDRHERHRQRNIARFERMVAASQARRAA